ncbi:MAG: PKD domain-containing protein, partial [Bacteroidia bacterium]
YKTFGENEFGFSIPFYNKKSTLIIDPEPYVFWSTYYGGNNVTQNYGITTDNFGNVITIGVTSSTTSIATSGTYQASYYGNSDAFIVKFSSTGSRKWGTYYGGSNLDRGMSVVTDFFCNIYASGSTMSSNNIATSGAYQTAFAGGGTYYLGDVFIAKFDSNGVIQWGTYYGGSGEELATQIINDASGNLFLVGQTTSTSGIATTGAYQTFFAASGAFDAFIVKFSSGGVRQWGSYYGQGGDTYGRGITLDSYGNIIICGFTNAASGFATTGAYQMLNGGLSDGFIAKFNSSFSSKIWGTYFGGSGTENGLYITSDANDNLYFCGKTNSSNGIATSGANQSVYGGAGTNGDGDVFLAKFNSSGAIQWSTYFGGSGDESLWGSKGVDLEGNLLIIGQTTSSNRIASAGAYQSYLGGGTDAFLAKFNLNGSKMWGTYFGGTNNDMGSAITRDISGNAFATGFTNSTSGIAISGAYQTSFGAGSMDAFIIKFDPDCFGNAQFTTGGPTTFCNGNNLVLSSGNPSGLTFQWMLNNNNISGATQSFFNATLPGDYKLTTVNSRGCPDTSSPVHVIVNPLPQASISVSSSTAICKGDSILINANTGTTLKYHWKKNGAYLTSADTNSFYFAKTTGAFSVVVTDSNNCSSTSAPVSLKVEPSTVINNSRSTNLCPGDTVTFSADTGNGYAYQWKKNEQNIFGATNNYYSTGTFGNYYVVVSTNNGCKDSSAVLPVILNPQPIAGFAQNSLAQCISGNNFTFVDTSTISSGAITPTWNFSNGDTSTQINFSKTFQAANTYSVKLISASNFGCTDSVTKNFSVYPQPNAGFTQTNFSQCLSGNNFMLNDTSVISSGTFSLLWNLGDTTTSVNSSLKKSFLNAGIYTIKLFVSSDHNCTDSSIKTFSVYPQPKVGFNQNSFSQCLSGNIFLLNDTSSISSGALTRLWYFSDGDTSTSSVSGKSFTNSGIFSAKLFEISDHNCIDSSIKTFTVYPQPNVGFRQNNLLTGQAGLSQCLSGNNFLLNDTSNILSGTISRLWSFSDGDTSTFSIVSKRFLNDGTYSVTLSEISDHNCTDSATKSFTVYPQPISGFTQIPPGRDAQCLSGNNFILNDTSTASSGVLTRLWSFGDSTTLASGNVNKSYSKAGIYRVKLVVTSKNNCSDSTTKIFTVYPQTKIGFTINNPNQCAGGNSFLITDTSILSSGTFLRLWHLGKYQSSVDSIVNLVSNLWGTYTIKLNTTTNNGCTDSIQKTITIYADPIADFIAEPQRQCFIGNKISFINHSSEPDGAKTKLWFWNFGDGTTDTSENPNKSFNAPGTHAVGLRVVNSNNCTNSTIRSVSLDKNPDKPQMLAVTSTQLQSSYSPSETYQWFLNNDSIPNAYSQTIFVHKNGIYRVAIGNGCTNISDPLNITLFNNVQIIVIPNPNNGNFTLDFIALPGEKQIEIYDMQGMFINQFTTYENIFEINSFLSSGMYVLKVIAESGTFSVKVVVE